MKLLLGVMLHVGVFGAVVTIDHAIQLSFGSSVADSTTPLLYVSSAKHLRHEILFCGTPCSCRRLLCRGYGAGS